MKYTGKNGAYFEIQTITEENCSFLKESRENELSLMWFESDDNNFVIDAVPYTFNANTLVFLTEFHQVETIGVKQLKLLRFNKPFYCILDHDSEVGCKGILFFGASNTPVIQADSEELDILKTVWKMLEIEMGSRDNLQLEMLQMMLKRILILCTRIYKSQENYQQVEPKQADIIREFNFLVEQHFKEKRSVAEYADLLYKSPKTLSNLFKKLGDKSPLQYIQERIMLEARRLLNYSEMSISEIAYELGYTDIQTFSRFFKKQEGISPNEFRNKQAAS